MVAEPVLFPGDVPLQPGAPVIDESDFLDASPGSAGVVPGTEAQRGSYCTLELRVPRRMPVDERTKRNDGLARLIAVENRLGGLG